MNKLAIVTLLVFTTSLYSCKTVSSHIYKEVSYPKETPFMTVVKLKSAEQFLAYDEAMQYIDVKKVYAKSEDPISDWKKMLIFYYNIGKDPKFTNSFKYYKYEIIENIQNNQAFVTFIDENKSSIKETKYTLENRNNTWVVVGIKYKK